MRNDIAGAQCVATAQANDFDIVLARCSRLFHLGGMRVVRERARVCRWIGPAVAGAMLKQKLRHLVEAPNELRRIALAAARPIAVL
jgi:hypothetical protein